MFGLLLQEVVKPNPDNPSVPYTDRVVEYPSHWTLDVAKDFIERTIPQAFVRLFPRVDVFAGGGVREAPVKVILADLSPTGSASATIIPDKSRMSSPDTRPLYSQLRQFRPCAVEGGTVLFKVSRAQVILQLAEVILIAWTTFHTFLFAHCSMVIVRIRSGHPCDVCNVVVVLGLIRLFVD